MTAAFDPRPGDLVRLRSGGPAMTVRARTRSSASCSWLEDGRLRQAMFAVEELVPDALAATAAALHEASEAIEAARRATARIDLELPDPPPASTPAPRPPGASSSS